MMLEQVAAELGISRSLAYKIERKALDKLRQSPGLGAFARELRPDAEPRGRYRYEGLGRVQGRAEEE